MNLAQVFLHFQLKTIVKSNVIGSKAFQGFQGISTNHFMLDFKLKNHNSLLKSKCYMVQF